MNKNLTALIILDGYGFTRCTEGNAVEQAQTPFLDTISRDCPHTLITASGLGVGLPEGQMGNSEVGHLNLGAGRIVYQELTRITKSIEDGDFFTNEAFLAGIKSAKQKGGALHLMGLLSDGGVHSHECHLYALLNLAKKQGLDRVYVHCLMDGRDTAPDSGLGHVKSLEAKMAELGVGKIATIMGRYYAMDRDNRWDRVEKAYDAMTVGTGNHAASAVQVMEETYAAKITDEFVLPTIIDTAEDKTIKGNDTIIFFNFRPDRARELTRAFIDPEFKEFERKTGYLGLYYVTMTQYDKSFENVAIAYKPVTIDNTLGEYLSNLGISQLRIAETEKYAHVTYFFNGGLEKQYPLEDRILVPSPHVATYDLQPEMSAYEVADKAVAAVESEKYQLMILNFANADMVGHTGIFEAAEKAVEVVDACAKKVIDAILAKGGKVIVTADHGNAEKMIDYETHMPFTAHTSNQVKCILLGDGDVALRDDGRLADVAPTLLDLMGLAKPAQMTGETLIKEK
ncbi:2,3-bisphosphoglycerate-independent phosphoglycerate mutase [Acetobacterium wieringae]|uniref:2,3-bisphosphoglycerate-independent phosphoglycerate mutase n=1 Tax=Acetobacterium wieringae TaxID=52694 RepID=A0A5D0WPG1_9FIRM|nr:2,3-bisphosphoglycerate-independent phosphoglycerate mutase [Acetobacterium wieringae]TYC85993.1 2,3-bisphosphoglycerate-independent phosphoglycerate mutase [Acetobacterium wieringae]UYO63860.1 2,3-bisphosphoglycerate-independent phosphoglycerate mutase [Acetobacterium wieringae]VUZ27238.1 2,3-bisphosphoglycerate-independent phosphoglycerate mutase [Acetobacterium wieringae]